MDQLYPPQLLFSDDVIREGEASGRSGHALVRTCGGHSFFADDASLQVLLRLWGCENVYSSPQSPLHRLIANPGDTIYGASHPEIVRSKGLVLPSCCRKRYQAGFRATRRRIVYTNCIMPDPVCNDTNNKRIFDLVNHYHDFVIADTPIADKFAAENSDQTYALDLDVFSPDLKSPGFKLPPNGKLGMMHSFVDAGRANAQRDVKGSPFISAAIKQ